MRLGVLLSTGEGIAPDYVAALYWNQLAVEQGVAPAAYNQGTIYRDLNKPAMAFRCYGRAAAMGDYDACLQMGLCCLFAYGTKQDFDKAYGYFERVVKSASRAVSQRSLENALYWMALLDLMGKGRLKRSVVRARKMLEAANADEDHEQANELLNLIGKTRYLQR